MTQCVCGSHDTDNITGWFEYEYKGYVQEVEYSYTECQNCGLEFQTATQGNECAKQIRAARSTINQWILDNPEE
jgi:hypothetical protein